MNYTRIGGIVLNNKKRAIAAIIIYLLIMIIGVSINNNFFSMENNIGRLISLSVIQVVKKCYFNTSYVVIKRC